MYFERFCTGVPVWSYFAQFCEDDAPKRVAALRGAPQEALLISSLIWTSIVPRLGRETHETLDNIQYHRRLFHVVVMSLETEGYYRALRHKHHAVSYIETTYVCVGHIFIVGRVNWFQTLSRFCNYRCYGIGASRLFVNIFSITNETVVAVADPIDVDTVFTAAPTTAVVAAAAVAATNCCLRPMNYTRCIRAWRSTTAVWRRVTWLNYY